MIYIPLSSNASPARSLDLAVDVLKLILDEIESQSATVLLSPEQAQKITPPCEVAGQFCPAGDVDTFVFDAKKQLEQFNIITIALKILLAFIGTITLGIGGVGLINMMLVSVTQRTREIGVRKALGARHGDVMMQILIEAVGLASVGGALGTGLGALITFLLGRLFDIGMHITLSYVALALSVSSIVGIVSGWYPASRAAKLDPVVALRAE